MSWHKITLPLISTGIDPSVVEIGDFAKAVYERENKPEGFAMFHASRLGESGFAETFFVYLTPKAAELCSELAERFTLEPCDVPARDEPDIAFVFGDPLMMGQLKDKFEPEPGTIEWRLAEAAKEEAARELAAWEAAQAEAAAEAAQTESTQADSAQA